MANRYWVGNTGNWDNNTSRWSATSGGATGASVPTLADDVFFDSASNAAAYTVTLTTAPVCRSVSISGPASGNVTIAGSAAWSIYGSLTIAATGVTWTSTSIITFAATTTGWTVTTNGVSLTNAVVFNGAGGEWTLGSAYTATSTITVSQGTFTTNNFNVTISASTFASLGAGVRTLNLGSSSITCLIWNCLAATNLTVNAGTSTITLLQAAGTFNGGGLTYYNVYKAVNGINIGDANNTFNALTNAGCNTGTYQLQINGNQTIGTLTANGGGGSYQRLRLISVNPGTQVTLTVGTFITNGNVDFADINMQGAAAPISVPTGGDGGNNTNINSLPAPKTVYWNLAAGGSYAASNVWAATSGGTPSSIYYPLIQDTAVIGDTGLNSGATITLNGSPAIGNLDLSTRTLPVTIGIGSNTGQSIYGNFTLSSAVTITFTTGILNFVGYNKTQTITTAGVVFPNTFGDL